MSRKVLITGVAGFLGSNLAGSYLEDGCVVIGIDNLIGGDLRNVPNGVDFHEIDLHDLEAITPLFKNVDLVIHAACTAHEGLSVFSPGIIFSNTAQIAINTMIASVRNGVGRYVLCSSMARYGDHPEKPFRESHLCMPQDPYGIAKRSSEQVLEVMGAAHGLDYVIAVPHNIIGKNQKYDDPFRNVAAIMINLMLQGRQPYIYGDGAQVRCFSDVRDVLWCFKKLGDNKSVLGNVFNVGPDEGEVSILQLATLIADIIGFELDPIYVSDRPQEVKHAVCSTDKLRSFCGYETKYSLEESLRWMIRYIETRGVREFQYHLPIEINRENLPETWKNKWF